MGLGLRLQGVRRKVWGLSRFRALGLKAWGSGFLGLRFRASVWDVLGIRGYGDLQGFSKMYKHLHGSGFFLVFLISCCWTSFNDFYMKP